MSQKKQTSRDSKIAGYLFLGMLVTAGFVLFTIHWFAALMICFWFCAGIIASGHMIHDKIGYYAREIKDYHKLVDTRFDPDEPAGGIYRMANRDTEEKIH